MRALTHMGVKDLHLREFIDKIDSLRIKGWGLNLSTSESGNISGKVNLGKEVVLLYCVVVSGRTGPAGRAHLVEAAVWTTLCLGRGLK